MGVTDSADGRLAQVNLPESWSGPGWRPDSGVPPLEVIDGQHRLSAFDADDEDDFELPVVLFDGLDFSWQAYIFWTVNIKPKRINASLAYDLYPLLREQDWLEAGESLAVYRETRAQELVEALWSEPTSIWHDRINMLGQPGMRSSRPVTQAAFVRSLSTTLVRPFRGRWGLGGLFGGAEDNSGLGWPRGQQAAFLVFAWNALATAIAASDHGWAEQLRSKELIQPELAPQRDARLDLAVVGTQTLLASDQGVRAFHMVINDIAYLGAEEFGLNSWRVSSEIGEPDAEFSEATESLHENAVGEFLVELGIELAAYDWRNAQAPNLSEQEKDSKLALRGAGGYNVLRDRLLRYLAGASAGPLGGLAERVLAARNG